MQTEQSVQHPPHQLVQPRHTLVAPSPPSLLHPRRDGFYPALRPARAIAPRSPAPHARTPFCCQHLTSPPPPSSSCLGSPAPASTWTVLIGWCETVTRPLGPRMWPNPARQGRASTYELSGPGPSTPPSVWRASCRRRQPLLAGSQKCTHLRGWIWRFQGLGVSGGIRSLILPTFMARPETVSEE